MEQADLLSEIAKGNEHAFTALFDYYKDKVFNTALIYLRSQEEAEELTQDVFIEIYRSADKFEGKSSVNTWIYRIAVNKCLDFLRYKKRKKRMGLLQSLFRQDTLEPVFDPPHFDHPGVILENKDNARILFAAIDELPEQQRTAYILTYVEGLPAKEVAAVMGTSPKAVESLNQRAKAALRKKIEKYYPERGK